MPVSIQVVKGADVIVRATAVEYAVPPSVNFVRPGVETRSRRGTIRFDTTETIRGPVAKELILPGELVDHDDFNEKPAPYNIVRPDGRRGSCYASTYRKEAQYLLLLAKNQAGELTIEWFPLAPVNEQLHPVNEQLHSDTDPWLLWVRKQAGNQKPKR
jgi:hypothetical protein